MTKYCVRLEYTIKEVIEKFDENKDRVAVVLNENNKVVGVVSQGDIIRALCEGKNIFSKVETIVKPSFLYTKSRDMERAYKMFRSKKITMIPIIDDDYKLKGVITLDDIYTYLEEQRHE